MTKEDLTKEEYGYVEKLLTVIEASGRNYDIDKILRAYLCAKKLHEGQKRNSGEPYIVHPVAVSDSIRTQSARRFSTIRSRTAPTG